MLMPWEQEFCANGCGAILPNAKKNSRKVKRYFRNAKEICARCWTAPRNPLLDRSIPIGNQAS